MDDCTGLENRSIRKGTVSSNLTPTDILAYCKRAQLIAKLFLVFLHLEKESPMSRMQVRRIVNICTAVIIVSVLLLDHSRLFVQILAGVGLAGGLAGMGFALFQYEMFVSKRRAEKKDESH